MVIWRNDKLQGVKLHQTKPVKEADRGVEKNAWSSRAAKNQKNMLPFFFAVGENDFAVWANTYAYTHLDCEAYL